MQNSSYINAFDLSDEKWIDYLHAEGVVVVKNVVSKEEVTESIKLFWDWIESLNSGIDRNKPESWTNDCWPGNPDLGFFTSYGGGHSKASWFLRTRPKIKQAFGKIWNTDKLISSFDTFIAWRPWWVDKSWTPCVEGLHCDQDPHSKVGFHCVQGMVPLYDVDQIGGLMVVPRTNTDKVQQELRSRYSSCGDFLELRRDDPLRQKAVLIKCTAGDLILWDSRSIHGGFVINPTQQFKLDHKDHLVRLSLTVTMMPKQSATNQVLEKRRWAFQNKIALTHWANQFTKNPMGVMAKGIDREKIKLEEVEFSEQVRDLVG